MAVIIISPYSVPLVQSGDTSLLLRVYCNQNYVTYEGVDIIAGTGVTGTWYLEYVCPVTANVAAIPQVTIYSTTDRTAGQFPLWTAVFYNMTGTQVRGYLFPQGLQIPATPTTTSWSAIAVYNALPPQPYINSYYNANQSDARYPQLSGLTVGVVPQVASVSPPLLVDTHFSSAGANSDIDIGVSGLLTFGSKEASDPAWKRFGTTLEFRTADDSGTLAPILGGVVANYGLLAGPVVIDTNSTALQPLLTAPSAHDVMVMTIIIYGNTENLALWTSTVLIGTPAGGGGEWRTLSTSALDIGPVANKTMNYLIPEAIAGPRIVPAGTDMNVEFGTSSGTLGATLQFSLYGVLLL